MGINWSALLSAVAIVTVMAAAPGTSNYQLRDYGIGTGGGTGSTDNYRFEGITGETSGPRMGTDTYSAGTGLQEVQQAGVPPAPAFTNDGNWVNKLHFTVNTGDNPSDARFAIAISSDNFVTTNYIQNDFTIGATLGLEDYQTYANWGGASGEEVIGLSADTAYSIKVKATQGDLTESAFSATATAATTELSLGFDMDVSNTDEETSPPYSISFGDLFANTVTDSPSKIWFDIDTSSSNGGRIYIVGTNTGLKSESSNYTITSSTGDLSVLNEGFGAQSTSNTQTGGGPLLVESPYDGAGDNVGLVDSQYRTIYSSAGAVEAGRSSFVLKAKSSGVTPAAEDYAEIYTAVAAATF